IPRFYKFEKLFNGKSYISNYASPRSSPRRLLRVVCDLDNLGSFSNDVAWNIREVQEDAAPNYQNSIVRRKPVTYRLHCRRKTAAEEPVIRGEDRPSRYRR